MSGDVRSGLWRFSSEEPPSLQPALLLGQEGSGQRGPVECCLSAVRPQGSVSWAQSLSGDPAPARDCLPGPSQLTFVPVWPMRGGVGGPAVPGRPR